MESVYPYSSSILEFLLMKRFEFQKDGFMETFGSLLGIICVWKLFTWNPAGGAGGWLTTLLPSRASYYIRFYTGCLKNWISDFRDKRYAVRGNLIEKEIERWREREREWERYRERERDLKVFTTGEKKIW